MNRYLKAWMLSILAFLHYTPEDEERACGVLLLTLVSLAMLPSVIIRLRYKLKHFPPPTPPGAWPIVGHLPALLGGQPHLTMELWSKILGDIYELRLGSFSTIVISSPEMAREVLGNQDETWASRPKWKLSDFYFSYNYRGIACAQYSPVWRLLRKITVLELLTTKRLAATKAVRVEEAQQMIWSIVQDIAEKGKLVDVKLRVNIKVTDEMFRMVLGRRFSGSIRGAELDAAGQEFKEVINEFQHLKGLFLIGDFVPWLRRFDIGGFEERMKAVQGRLDTFLNKVLDEHEAKSRKGLIAESEKDMVDVLLRRMQKQDQNAALKVDKECIKATVMSMISVGVDTTSVTVEWGMSELMRNPSVYQKLSTELDTVIGRNRLVQEADIGSLKYLQAVVKEVFRLHPPAPLLIPHESTADCELDGCFIPAGTRLIVHAHAIGRNPKAWENPLLFSPERFLRRSEIDVKGQDFGLLPFGSGSRACPAIAMGTVSVQWTLAVLVHAFAWSLPAGLSPEDLDMSKEFGITTPRAKTLFLHAALRLKSDLYGPPSL